MKHNGYDIYGVGNALLDMVYEISEQKLTELGAEKSIMSLMEEDEHHQLIAGLSDTNAIKACGGSAANTIITAQALGASTYYSCSVANDKHGDYYLQDLMSHGVKTNLTESNRPTATTGICVAMITPDAERTMCTHLGITTALHHSVLDEQAIASANYIYIEGYLVASDTSREAAIHARKFAEKHGTKTSLTLSDPFMVKAFKNDLLTMIGTQVDLLFCNEQEALMFCDTHDLKMAEEQLKKYAKQFVITLGNNGAIAFDGQTSYHCPAREVKLLDTLGAGDTFSGAFLYAINQGCSFKQAAHFANTAAAKVVEKIGPRLDSNELKQLSKHLLEAIVIN